MPVIDASIAVKWFVDESDSPQALSLRDAHIYRQSPLVIPDLLIYEVSNVLLHNPRFTQSEVLRAVRTIYDLQIEILVPTEELVQEAIRLAIGHKLTFYDALYVGLAHQVGMELLTADRRLYQRVKQLSFVQLLQ